MHPSSCPRPTRTYSPRKGRRSGATCSRGCTSARGRTRPARAAPAGAAGTAWPSDDGGAGAYPLRAGDGLELLLEVRVVRCLRIEGLHVRKHVLGREDERVLRDAWIDLQEL